VVTVQMTVLNPDGSVHDQFNHDLTFRDLVGWLQVFDRVEAGAALTTGSEGETYQLTALNRGKYWSRALRAANLTR
jgi:hypothetical protein